MAFEDYYNQALKDATDQYGTILKGYQDRQASAIAQSAGFGQTKLRDTAEAYQARGGQLDQQAISRGLGNTTVRNTMQQGNFNAGQRSLNAVREENAREQLGIYGQYSGDTLGYAASGGAALRQFGLQGQQLALQYQQLGQQGSQFDRQFDYKVQQDQFARLGGGGGGGGGGSSGGGSGGGRGGQSYDPSASLEKEHELNQRASESLDRLNAAKAGNASAERIAALRADAERDIAAANNASREFIAQENNAAHRPPGSKPYGGDTGLIVGPNGQEWDTGPAGQFKPPWEDDELNPLPDTGSSGGGDPYDYFG